MAAKLASEKQIKEAATALDASEAKEEAPVTSPVKKTPKPRRILSKSKVDKAVEEASGEVAEDDDDEGLEQFINSAPDAHRRDAEKKEEEKPRKKRHLRGQKTVITVNIEPDLLDEFDDWCKECGLSRTMAIKLQIRKLLQKQTFS